jgi:ribosome-associated translation inhibitor RaiA
MHCEDMQAMRIEVLGEDTIGAEARTYAEYRLFDALTGVVDTNRVKHARLVLERTAPDRASDGVSCTVTVDMDGSDSLRIEVSAGHPYAAINRAAGCASGALLACQSEEVFVDIPIDFLIRAGQADTTDALREHAARKLSFALRRFRDRIRRLTVRVVDVNGPRKGVDSRCSIAADLVDGRRLFVAATEAWPFAAVTHAVSRLGEAMGRSHNRSAARRHARR